MVRLRCDKCNDDASVVSLLGYSETYLCDYCENKRQQGKNALPYRQLAHIVKSDSEADPLVCGICKISPARVFSPNHAQVFSAKKQQRLNVDQVYCWRCNEEAEKEDNGAPRFLLFGVQLKGTPKETCPVDDPPFCYWNVDSDTESVLIDSPQGVIPTVSVNSNLISSGSIKSMATSKSNDTHETLGKTSTATPTPLHAGLINECASETDMEGAEGIVEGVRAAREAIWLSLGILQFPCGTIPVCELPGYKRAPPPMHRAKKRRCIKSDPPSPTQRRCMHCGVLKTPQWRAGPSGQKTLCNACGVKCAFVRLSQLTVMTGRRGVQH